MTNNYLSNLLDKGAQTQRIVEPRLKSRFENGQFQSIDDRVANVSENEGFPTQKRDTIAKKFSKEDTSSVLAPNQTINSEQKTINERHEHQNSLLNTTEKKNYSLTEKTNKNNREQKKAARTKSRDIDKKSDETSVYISKNTIETKTHGLLNKPSKIVANKEVDSKRSHYKTTNENTLALPAQSSIKISIGRVEVKAVKPIKKRVINPKVKPNLKLSLEEYIAKRK